MQTHDAKPGTARSRGKEFFARNIWLAYSGFFFIEPILKNNPRYWVITSIAYVLFLALYFGAGYTRGKLQIFLLSALFAFGIIYTPFNVGAACASIFATAMLPFIVTNTRTVSGLLAAATLVIIAETYWLHLQFLNMAFVIFFTPVIGMINLFQAQKQQADSKLLLAHEEMAQLAKLAERERIARDMHDVLGHTLSVVVLKSELAGRIIDHDPARAKREISDVEQAARKALSEVREAIRGYRSEGLMAEIDRAHRTLDAAGVELTCESKPPSLPPAEETVVSLIVREAVTNVVRHAQASRCVMQFSNANGQILLTVQDNGHGGIREEGSGLRGMRERVEALGGSFSIDSTQGTRLNIEIPVRP